MDGFSDAGYLVLGLDYFRGDPVWKHRKDRNDKSNPDFDYEAWKRKHMAFADEAVPRWTEAVRQRFGRTETKYACVGYCFGAPYVCDQLATGDVAAGAFAHPAFLKESHFRKIQSRSWFHAAPRNVCAERDIKADSVFRSAGPLFLSCAEVDHTFDTESRRRAIDILQEDKKTYQLQLFAGVQHGFALRGDQNDPYQREFGGYVHTCRNDSHLVSLMSETNISSSAGYVKEESMRGIVAWLDFWLAQ